MSARRFSLATWYSIAGVALALGSPAGFLVVRGALARDLSVRFAVGDVARNPIIYAYLALSTTLIFSLFGLLLGRAADRLRAASEKDSLTGLFNRAHLDRRLEVELSRVARYGSLFSVLLVDVDGLKQINDGHGHAAGDEALRNVGRAVAETCRATDIPGRWGGDEFLVLAPGIDASRALQLANRLRAALRRSAPISGGVQTAVSIGVTDCAVAGADAASLVAAADSALYRAKAAGRDRAVVYDAEANTPSTRSAFVGHDSTSPRLRRPTGTGFA